ncbi:carboxypeptidase-like regulatory domain-containing protein [Pedobacter sp. KR3-3]|uniref:Carboxypeptidase-like regulatory domain-containing protein n=1 Tax=Pedobacter albus TaxID=3113905 RepID=A0ABU7I9P5_9SPHI|nr:carboxypeptidase-like regulatory domain-containing protein [Pedobacter sp. KR3-3]MEE1946186.1 carboxypeptidase-like regulatory domain-containing protein [Pedobacter sp. KR3-3]
MKKLLLPILILLILFGFKTSTTKTITGTVIDKSDGSGIPSASVKAMPSKTQVATDRNGQFKLDIDKRDKILVVSYLGYKTQTLTLTRKKKIEIKLEPNPIDPKHTIIVGGK